MAGADQKSFLATFSPWSTPRSSTPQSDRLSASHILQHSQGKDHTVTHRHKLGLRHYPSDCPPLKVRWFYAVDSPKRKPALIDQTKSDQKPLPPPKKFIPFSLKDSQSIESSFRTLSEIEDAQEQGQSGSKAAQVSTKVPVNEDYLFDVDVEQRELSPAYWIGPIYEVRRGTWFFQDSSGMRPCEENLATQLEEGFLKLRPWRMDMMGAKPAERVVMDERDQPEDSVSHPSKSSQSSRGVGNAPVASVPEPQHYRLFGAYMNRIVVYHDASTAWLNTDDFMSRVSTTVYQKLGGTSGTKVVRGYAEPRRVRETLDARTSERKPVEKASGTVSSKAAATTRVQTMEANTTETPLMTGSSIEADRVINRPRSTLERQMSSLAGEPQNPAELEEQARMQEEQEMEDLREVDGEDREREVDHLVLVTHGIGQRLGLRLESINFIHDVNVLRKTLKSVYKASPDLQALNSAFADSNGNCRVQVLPVCWRHLLDFPYRGVRQNRRELDLTDADTFEDDSYPSLADITLDSVPAVRNLISDLAMDVLLYQSRYCEHISNIVRQECNRIFNLYRKRNPSFNGSVSLCGHSLGSAILFDILCHQPSQPNTTKGQPMAGTREEAPDKRNEWKDALEFECEEFFCLGSPIALFQMLKGKTITGYSSLNTKSHRSAFGIELESRTLAPRADSKRDSECCGGRDEIGNSAIFSTPKCRDLYNIFHPSDPVSYRIEPLISSAMASLKPQPLPSVKKSLWTTSGQSLSILRDRMGQSVGSLWNNFTSGVASSLLNRSLGLNAEEPPVASGKLSEPAGHKRHQSGSSQPAAQEPEEHPQPLIDPDIETLYDGFQKRRTDHRKDQAHSSDEVKAGLESDDQERKVRFEDAKVRALNSNGRVDYSIQEGAFDISLIASIASHLTYWGDEDVNHFMLSQILSRKSRHRIKDIHGNK